MKRVEKILGKLTQSQANIFRDLEHCKNAAKLVIDTTLEQLDNNNISIETTKSFMREVMHELEARKKLEYQMWVKIKEDYNINDEEFKRCWLDADTCEIQILTKEYFDKTHDGRFDLTKFNVMWNS